MKNLKSSFIKVIVAAVCSAYLVAPVIGPAIDKTVIAQKAEQPTSSGSMLVLQRGRSRAMEKTCSFCGLSYSETTWEPCDDCTGDDIYAVDSKPPHGFILLNSERGSYKTCAVSFQAAIMSLTQGEFTPREAGEPLR